MPRGRPSGRPIQSGRELRRAVAAAALALCGCATARSPLVLRVDLRDPRLSAGHERRVEAVLWNRGKTDVRFEEGAALRYMLTCRRPEDRPGEPGFGVGSGIEGGVWGGVTDRVPDPSDPLYCREYPPDSFVLPAGGRLPLTIDIVTPGGCAAGEAELEVSFAAPDHGRKCPGIYYGEMGSTTRRLEIRRPGGGAQPSSPVSRLACDLQPDVGAAGQGLVLTLRNTGSRAWRGRLVPAIVLEPEAEDGDTYWAPIELSDPPAPLAVDASWSVEIPPRGELRRVLTLDGLGWGDPYGAWPAEPYAHPAPGRYRARFWIDVVGGKSWELRCSEAAIEIPAH